MSALFGIRNSSLAHVFTDAAFYDLRDGTIRAISSKQIITPNGIVVAGGGLHQVTIRFAHLAAACAGFDEVIRIAPELWAEACKDVPKWGEGMPCALLVAGWSRERERAEMDGFNTRSVGVGTESEHFADYVVFATGPASEPMECIDRFAQRFTDAAARDAFDPSDGIALMEELRRYPKPFQHAARSAVGGFVEHVVVTSEGIVARVIHNWPDLIGSPIDLEGASEWRHQLSRDEFFRTREALARRWWRSGSNRVEGGLFGLECRLPSLGSGAFDIPTVLAAVRRNGVACNSNA